MALDSDVVAEDLESKIDTVAEKVAANTEKLEDHTKILEATWPTQVAPFS